MNELLSNPAVQTALITVIVIGLQALATWLKQKFPTQAASVEANWCYLQPAVEYALIRVQAASVSGAVPYAAIIAQAVTQFADSYRKLEGKDASTAELNAARTEITAAVSRATTGG